MVDHSDPIVARYSIQKTETLLVLESAERAPKSGLVIEQGRHNEVVIYERTTGTALVVSFIQLKGSNKVSMLYRAPENFKLLRIKAGAAGVEPATS